MSRLQSICNQIVSPSHLLKPKKTSMTRPGKCLVLTAPELRQGFDLQQQTHLLGPVLLLLQELQAFALHEPEHVEEAIVA